MGTALVCKDELGAITHVLRHTVVSILLLELLVLVFSFYFIFIFHFTLCTLLKSNLCISIYSLLCIFILPSVSFLSFFQYLSVLCKAH